MFLFAKIRVHIVLCVSLFLVVANGYAKFNLCFFCDFLTWY